VVLAIVVQLTPEFIDDSHLITLPVWPVRLSVPLFVPEQTVVLVPTEPPTDIPLFTVIVAALDSLVAT